MWCKVNMISLKHHGGLLLIVKIDKLYAPFLPTWFAKQECDEQKIGRNDAFIYMPPPGVGTEPNKLFSMDLLRYPTFCVR
jgi:hypothetical protein